MFCNQCGAKISDSSQKFCEHCGAEIRKVEIPPDVSEPAPKEAPRYAIEESTSYRKGGLFDINRDYYIFKEKYWDWGGGDVYDENGEVIGIMHRKILSVRRRIELKEVDGSLAAYIHGKLISARQAQSLFLPDGTLIARIKRKIITWPWRPQFFLTDPEGNIWYRARGKIFGWSFKVFDESTGEMIAEIEKADRWRDMFLGGLLDYKDTYALRIIDKETDRRILAGFVMSIDNILHDQ